MNSCNVDITFVCLKCVFEKSESFFFIYFCRSSSASCFQEQISLTFETACQHLAELDIPLEKTLKDFAECQEQTFRSSPFIPLGKKVFTKRYSE